MEYYSTVKRKERPVHITTHMNLENIILSARSQAPKDPGMYDFCSHRSPEWGNLERQKVGQRLLRDEGREARLETGELK